jgi:phytoene synthase
MKPSPEGPHWGFPNPATPLGSPAYYAVRFSTEHRRLGFALLLAWYREIRAIAAHPADPGAARLKLDWWRQELNATAHGEARHPLAVALQDALAVTPGDAALAGIIDATEEEISQPTLADADAFTDACRRTGGNLFLGLGRFEQTAELARRTCMETGAYCDAVERIRLVAGCPHRLPAGLGPVALTTLDAAQRTIHLESLLGAFDLPAGRCPAGLPEPARRLTALATGLHTKMRRRGYPVADTLIDRAPIAHLWTAWRCH